MMSTPIETQAGRRTSVWLDEKRPVSVFLWSFFFTWFVFALTWVIPFFVVFLGVGLRRGSSPFDRVWIEVAVGFLLRLVQLTPGYFLCFASVFLVARLVAGRSLTGQEKNWIAMLAITFAVAGLAAGIAATLWSFRELTLVFVFYGDAVHDFIPGPGFLSQLGFSWGVYAILCSLVAVPRNQDTVEKHGLTIPLKLAIVAIFLSLLAGSIRFALALK